MKAYHFLMADMRSGYGNEPSWKVGETRRLRGPVALCERGYHSSPSWFDALKYARGSVACLVDVSRPAAKDGDKQASRRRTLLAAVNAERELRLFAVDCATRALSRERQRGREPDTRSWKALKAAVQFAYGLIGDAAWAAAGDAAGDAAEDAAWDAAKAAAGDAAWDAAKAAAWDAARDAAGDAAKAAAWDAARDAAWAAAGYAEEEWQRKRLAWRLNRLMSQTIGKAT
jgi:hypothetical protein